MKYLFLLLVLMIYPLKSLAQEPNPDLFQTWYLYFVESSDLGTPYEVSEIEPPIYPYIIISEDLQFNGEGAYNSFNGMYVIEYDTILETIDFTSTTADCGIQIHNFFETEYFSFVQGGGWYEIIDEEDHQVLSIDNAVFGSAVFKTIPLSTPDFDFNTIKIHPNPGSSIIFIESQHNFVLKMELFDVFGKNIQTQNIQTKEIDISGLHSGIYLLKIYTENKTFVKKIIKKDTAH